MDMWIHGHHIQKMVVGLDVDIEFKMGYLDPGPSGSGTQDAGPGNLDPGTRTGPGASVEPRPGDRELGTWTLGPRPVVDLALGARTRGARSEDLDPRSWARGPGPGDRDLWRKEPAAYPSLS